MPTEVAMSYTVSTPYTTPSDHHIATSQHLSTETKSGAITLISPNGRRQGVNVIVYQTTLEHFAVLYPQKKICRPLGVINIKTTKVERLPDKQNSGFSVRQLGFDTPMTLTFLCESRDLESWLNAFAHTKNVVGGAGGMGLRHQSSLPCVEEDEEF